MINVKNITVRKGNKDIVKDASFQISSGKITVVVGKNGAGKSTLLEALTQGNFIPDGKTIWDGKDIITINTRILAHAWLSPSSSRSPAPDRFACDVGQQHMAAPAPPCEAAG